MPFPCVDPVSSFLIVAGHSSLIYSLRVSNILPKRGEG